MELQTLLVMIGVLVLAVAIWSWRRSARRARLGRTPVLIGEAMAKRGISPADAEAAGLEGDLGKAVQLCAQCSDLVRPRSARTRR
jgi:type VI protein secretion system component VasK